MFKLLIVDDEPLVQIGLKSMLNWADLGIELCPTAVNGEQALKIIHEYKPDLVITDIKMPIMNGLEMIKKCKEQAGDIPQFIILTSYEEFPLIKEAMKYEVIDYLVKLELNAEILTESVKKALQRITKKQMNGQDLPGFEYRFFYEKFMIRLLNGLFDSEEQFLLQSKELKLDFSSPSYILCLCSIITADKEQTPTDKLLNLYLSSKQMVEGIASKYMPCLVTSLDLKHFCIIFCLPANESANYTDKVHNILIDTFKMVENYFNVQIQASIGRPCTNPYLISEAYQDARQIQINCSEKQPIVFYNHQETGAKTTKNNTFHLGIFKSDIQKAFETYDTNALSTTLNAIIDLLRSSSMRYLQAIDAACNLLYLSITLLPNGDSTVDGIFYQYPDGYRSIYRCTNVDQVIHWLGIFRDGLLEILHSQQKNYKNQLIRNVQSYIDSHIEEKLSLNEVATLFSISPNYLSQLFKKTKNIGFTEYVTQKKIAKAKVWISEGNMKIYEISERLGFDNAFYFSKVFKKVEGCSPRDYIQCK